MNRDTKFKIKIIGRIMHALLHICGLVSLAGIILFLHLDIARLNAKVNALENTIKQSSFPKYTVIQGHKFKIIPVLDDNVE